MWTYIHENEKSSGKFRVVDSTEKPEDRRGQVFYSKVLFSKIDSGLNEKHVIRWVFFESHI